MKLESLLSRIDIDLPQEGMELKLLLEQLEQVIVIKALTQAGGNTTKAADLLKMNRTTLVEKINRIGIREWLEDYKREVLALIPPRDYTAWKNEQLRV